MLSRHQKKQGTNSGGKPPSEFPKVCLLFGCSLSSDVLTVACSKQAFGVIRSCDDESVALVEGDTEVEKFARYEDHQHHGWHIKKSVCLIVASWWSSRNARDYMTAGKTARIPGSWPIGKAPALKAECAACTRKEGSIPSFPAKFARGDHPFTPDN